MSYIIPIPQNYPIGQDEKGGTEIYYSSHFKRWTDDVLARIGGISGGVYNSLTNTGGVVIWDLNQSPNAVVILNVATTSITTLNQVAGAPPYRLTLVQDATGGRLVSWGSEFKWPSGTTPVLTVTANAVDDIAFASDGTNIKYQYSVKDIR